MANEFINNSLKVISVPVTLFILLLPFSFLTGWNLTTAKCHQFATKEKGLQKRTN